MLYHNFISRINLIFIFVADDDINGQVLEVFLLGSGNKNSKKMFNIWEVFHSNITCTFVYGNTFIVGVDCGNVSIVYETLLI